VPRWARIPLDDQDGWTGQSGESGSVLVLRLGAFSSTNLDAEKFNDFFVFAT
jgi:hypothetical protein